MVKNDNNNVEEFKLVTGESFVIQPNQQPIPVIDAHTLQGNEIIVTNSDAKFIFIKDGVEQVVNLSCPSCSILTPKGIETVELDNRVTFNGEATDNASFSADDIESLQNAILAGQDPTTLFEAPAAGNESAAGTVGLNGSSATASFITINYDNNSVLAEAGFDTAYNPHRTTQAIDPNVILAADGGESGSMTIVEGDLSPQTGEHGYPVQTSTSIIVEAATLPLESGSFVFDPLSVNALITELNNEITAGGQAVSFVYDTQTNSIIGRLNGETVMSITLDASSNNGRDVTVSMTTTINQPIDHAEGNDNGLVSRDGDTITVDVAIQGADSNGNPLDKPINVDISIKDGANPEFGTDTGTTINESSQQGQIIHGEVPLDVGSDAIHQIDFNAEQSSLSTITSNGEATTFTVAGNVLTVVDSHDKPVMVVTIATDGSYTVEVIGPIDQNAADIANISLGVTATDNDGDTASGQVVITIKDGSDAAGNEQGQVTITEGDLTPQGSEHGYPVSGTTTIAIEAGTDRLDPTKVTIDPKQLTSLITELESELTTGNNEAISFHYDSATGELIGLTANGEQVVTVSLSAVQAANGHDVAVNVTITQEKPLNHTDNGNQGLVDSVNDKITIDVPIQVQDTDGDWLQKPANVDITIKDGANPEFGTDTGTTINESSQQGQIIHGEVPLDIGSDAIHQIDFNAEQPSLSTITSNGEATTFTVAGNVLTVVDSHDKPVMVVTIATDGSYTVEVTGSIDQDAADIANISLGVTATDNDGDTASGQVVITIKDGSDAAGNEQGQVTITEGDLTPQGSEHGYPVSGTTTIAIEAGIDRLDPTKVTIDPKQLTSLITELESELTTGNNEAISFHYDSATGELIGLTANGEQVVTVSLSAVQAANGHDVAVNVTITQEKPLNHTDNGNQGLVDSVNDKITIDVPIQVQDTDGDWLQKPANVDITIKDGANPEFGTDTGTTINESSQQGQIIHGEVPLDVGSDAIHQIDFNAEQPGLDGITSNGEATTFSVAGNVLTVVDSHDKPVMVVTIATDGSYTVEVTGSIDQDAADIANISLGVTATDNDGDTASGQVVITIKDGSDAAGNEQGQVTITEGDLTPQGSEHGYPVSGTTTIAIEAGADRLDPTKVTIDPKQLTSLITELESELTTGDHQAISFHYNSATGELIGLTANGEQVVTVSLSAVQAANGHDVAVNVTITQEKPLNHTDNGNQGLVDSVNDKITIDVPIQVQDTDGDWLQKPANVDITIKDGANPEFGTDTGTTINESSQQGQIIHGEVPLDVGSDAIHQIDFNAEQPSLSTITSNGEATTFTVAGNVLTVVDSHDKPVMVVTIATDGSYTVEVTGSIDQNAADIANISLGVTATDNDGDTASGQVVITIKDGSDAAGNEQGQVTITEGDLTPQGSEHGYPVSGTTTIAIEAGIDRLDPTKVTIDPKQLTSLITELESELTTGDHQAISFHYNSTTGELIGLTANGEQVVTVSLSAVQAANGHDVAVNVTITQEKPLNHTDNGNQGLVDSVNDKITIDVPIQVQDTDGDWLQKPANIDITIKDGANPEFGTDTGTTINESSQQGQIIHGEVPLDVGSDAIHQIDFNPEQPGLDGITSNGEATTFTVAGNVLTVVDSHDKPVMVVTIATDGSYTVEVTGSIDQDAADIANISLGVAATDNDGDTASGQVVITIKDGSDAAGNEQGQVTITEGDLTPQGSEHGYPVSGTTTIAIEAGTDRLDPTKVTIDPKQLTSLITELESELTTGNNEAISFHYDSATGELIGLTANGEQVVTVSLSAVQAANGHDVAVNVTITQEKPLNHTDNGNQGLVDSVNDKITIDVPIQVQDTDGDWLQKPANADITIKDGANPEFGTDTGTTINESSQQGQIIHGEVPLDIGSDAIHQIDFNAEQPSLSTITSNGEATTFTVAGNVLTVVDSHDKPVMVVTIATDGSYTVEVTGSIDQDAADIANISLGVTATDNDGDTASGQVVITIKDGSDAAGNEQGQVTITEGDLTPQGSEHGYPVSGTATITIEAGADRLDPTKVTIDPKQLTSLITELESELTTGNNEAISFHYDSATGELIGLTANGEQVVTVSLSAVQAANGHDVAVNVTITQEKPLNHTDNGNQGLVDSVNDKITIDVPIQVQDTDGDWLQKPANVDITIKDGANPEFGTDTGTTINESSQQGQIIHGEVPLDVGSDAIHQIDFNAEQPGLDGITSNGEATTFTVAGNVLTVVDSHDKPVMVVTIATDGSYTVEVTGSIDQNAADIANISLGVTATDNDGDTASGQVVITIKDGSDAAGNEQGQVTITEGDLTPQGSEHGYPVSGTTTIAIEAGADRLDPTKVTIDPKQLTSLITELESELTTGNNEAISFHYDSATGELIGLTANGEQVVTVSLSAVQAANGHDVAVNVTITQEKPLNHTDNGNQGLVDSVNDKITIDVPIQVQDTDGDWLQKPANVDITIKDGANPEFGTDTGTTINESSQQGQIIHGEVPLDIGSDAIHQIDFNAEQPSLSTITSNGEATTFTVAGNVLTVVDSHDKPVMVVTIATDGSYTVEVTGSIDQDAADIANISLGVTATDNDGDTASGQVVITIKDGSDAAGNEQGQVTITEGDLTPQGSEHGYPVSGTTTIAIEAGTDRLDPTKVTIDPKQLTSLITELESELTTGNNEAISFHYDSATGELIGLTANGEQVVTVSLSAVQAANGHDVAVNVTITQEKPLNHTDNGNQGLVDSVNDKITIDVPIQVQDTDGDWLQKPANVDITIKDGANPEFGTDTGVTINESSQKGQIIHGDIPLDVGSDAIHQIDFNAEQPSLSTITSNGEATTFTVAGNVLTVMDSNDKPLMVVTIAIDGSYTVEVTGPFDQPIDNLVDIKLDVTAIDNDGDSTSGELNITIEDGGDSINVDRVTIILTEGDLDPMQGAGDLPYPVEQSGQLILRTDDDRILASTAKIDPSQQQTLINELTAELTSGGQPLIFSIDSDGNLIGKLAGSDTVAIRVDLTATQTGNNVTIDIKITQNIPLDHHQSQSSSGFVTIDDGKITINVPVQAQDTDGDSLTNPANVYIDIIDGQNPVFGQDKGTTIIETENGTTASGKIALDVGSDDIAHIHFLASQPSLDGIVSNNQATRYIVDGNEIRVVIDGGANDGEMVLTITIGNDGSYVVDQHQPIEQSNTAGDSVDIALSVVATDDDGDTSNTGQLDIHIKDGLDPTGAGVQASITITEGDLEHPQPGKGYPVVGTGQFTVDATDDALVANSLTITNSVKTTLLQELNGLTSDGEALTFSINIDANGVITITGITATGAQEAVTITLTPTAQANGDVSVEMSITQQLPLDHLSADGTYVDVNGGNITINVPVQMQDTDGDSLQQPVDVNITINDGQLPSFGHDTSATLNEGASGQATASGTISVDTGSDQIEKVYFGSDQASLNGLTSNGHATTYHLSADGTSVIVVLQSDPSQVVMEVSIDINGHYTINQQLPIDQVDDKAADNEKINLDVYAQDHDGDVSKPGQITINIHDGVNAAGGESGTITITEGDLTPTDGQQGYPVSGNTDIAVTAGVDRLDPTSATIDNAKLTALIDELQSELTADGAKISFVYDHNTGVLTGTADGKVVLTVTVTATQATNGHDADIKVSITQYSPLDHSGNANGGLVTVDGDKIVIDVPVQVKDTDGDLLDNDVNAQITIEDGTGPVIIAAPALTVEESDLASGTTPSGNGESALGDIIVNSGSDHVVNFKVDVESFNQQNDITSQGHKITLSQSSEGTYQGIANGNVVFTYYLLPTGRYIFQLHGTIDHSTQGEDQLTVEIPVYAVDKDGDVSASVNIDVTIQDDIPTVENVVLTAVESTTDHVSDTNYGYVIDSTGADGAQVTSVTIDGKEVALSDQNLSHDGFHEFNIYDGNQLLGQLFIKPDGQTIFRASADLTHSQEEIIKQIGFEVTDGDGDTAQGTITIELSDQDSILHTENSIGEEDDGRHSTDATDNVDPSRDGIAINMTIDVGDNDRGEHIGTVTIQPQTQAHGVFMYNGQPLTVNSDGSITLPAGAFKADAANENFTLQGVTFVPDADYSTSAAGIKFDVTAQVNTTDGGNHPVMNGEFSVNVQGIADTPTWNASSVDHYVTTEDQNNVLLNVVADLQDTDGSERLFYFITVPAEYQDKCTLEIGGQLLTETSPGSGVYKVTAKQMGSVEVNPVDNFSGDIKLTIQAQSKEKKNFVDGHQTADSAEKTVIINVNPDADDGVLKVTRVEANEDQRIDLSGHIDLTSLDDNTDNSEHLFLQISALPDGAVLYLNDQLLTPNADGVYEISYQDLNGLSLQPPLDSNVDFSITVNGVIRDVAQITDANGNVTTETSEKVIGPQTIDVALTGVVDRPEIVAENSDWTPLDDGRDGLQTTIKEDGEAKFDFKVISGEHVHADGKTDGSETLSVVISGIPKGTEVYDSEGNLQTLIYAGEDSNGQPIYQVNLDSLTNIAIKPPHNSTEDIHLDVRTVVTENDGASASFNSELVIHITPEIDAGNYSTVSEGLEDQATVINWKPMITDTQEHITGLALAGLPAGYQLFINGALLDTDSSGNVELTSQQLQTLLDGGKLTVTAPQDSDKDIQLTSTVTISQTDVDGNKETVTKDITGTLDVDITAVVEANGHLVVDDNGTLVTTIASGTDGVIDFSNDAGSDGKITWQNNDSSSTEVITQIVLEPIPEGFVIIGGINNGNGSWTVPQSALNDLKIIAPEGFKGELKLNINALVQDMSDDGDVSAKVKEQGTITLDFSANTESHTEKAADIIVDESYIVTGNEDHSVNLGQQMMDHIVTVSTANGNQSHDDFTLVISAKDLPDGASISGAAFDHITGEYVLQVPVAADGTVDLSGIKLNLPADYAGDFKFDVTYVTTDTDSGDVVTKTDSITVQVAPQVDGPKDVAITVVETDGLNADKQPISTSDDKQEQVYDNVAYEDGNIKLDLSVSLKDSHTSETSGKETVQSVTLILADSSDGVFIDAHGNVLGTSITIDQSQLDNIHFRPAQDFSGKVDINVTTTVVDSAIYDDTTGATVTDTKSFDSSVSFDVIAVNDEIKWQGVDKPIVGDEDTSISLAGISGSLEDIDGSEHIVSIKLENVPDGFIIEGAVNNGHGVWTIAASGESFDLSSVKVQPPHDFSGKVDIDIVVYSKEESLDKPAENRETITIDVTPIADKVDTDVNPNAAGDENSTITLDLGIKAYDDKNTINNPGVNVHENGAESLQIIITNVPDSSSFTLPDGVAGSAEKQADGSWIIKVTGSDLDTLIFHPGDANNQTVIDGNVWNGDLNLDIRAVDNGVVGTDSVAVDKTIHVDITPDNDAPVNHLPSDKLTVDEDATLVIKDLQITDVDSSDHNAVMDMTVTLSVEHGQLALAAGVDTSGLTITDNGDGKLVIKGDLNLINQLLDHGINYTGDKDFNGTDSLTMTTNDNGNSGAGGALTDSDSIDITVTPVNDAPINTVPAAFDVDEDSSHIITGLKIADVDAKEGGASSQMTVELSVEHGVLSIIAADTQGLTITDNGDGKLVISGDIDKINTLLDGGIKYTGDANFNGSDQLTMTTSDNGNVGSGGVLTDVSTVDITVTPVNDAPINTVPAAFDVDEDSSHIITGLKIADVEAKEGGTSAQMTVELSVDHGLLSIIAADTQGLTITNNGDGKLVISGDLDKINTLLDSGIKYTGDENFNGSDQLTMTTSDNGNVGSGGVLTDVSTVDITVAAVNDAPINEVPTSINADEDTATVIRGLGVSDVDFDEAKNNETMSVNLSVEHGSLLITLPENSTVQVINNGSGNVEIKGSLADIDAVLNSGVSYTGAADFSGNDTLTMTTNDGGNTGSGGSQTTTNKVDITVMPKPDAPSLTLSPEHLQTAAIQSSLGTMLPLIGLIAAASVHANASEKLFIRLADLGTAQVVNKDGQQIGIDFGNGHWQIPAEDLDNVYIKGLEQGTHKINIEAVSIVPDGDQAESQPIAVNVIVDNLAETKNVIGQNTASDQANLVIDSTAEATLFGGDGNDILVGGLASDILVGGRGDDILWGGDLDGHGDGVKDTFLWSEADFGTANAPATDTIMDFEVGIDTISLGNALHSQNIQSLDDLNNRLNIIEQQGNTEIQIFDDQHQVVQNIILEGVSHNDLFGDNALNMSNEDKLDSLINSGNLELGDNFGDQQSNTLVADNQGESLFGFDGNDILVAGQGNDILTGGNGDDVFTWHETSLSTVSNTDTITDFELDKDQINIRNLLTDDNSSLNMDDLLKHVSADVDGKGNINLEVNSREGQSQHIVLENVNPQNDLGLADGASSADIVSSLFSHNAFQVDNTH